MGYWISSIRDVFLLHSSHNLIDDYPVLNENFHWQLMALLLLRHALPMTDTDGDDEDPTAFFSVSWLAAHSIFIFLFKKISS